MKTKTFLLGFLLSIPIVPAFSQSYQPVHVVEKLKGLMCMNLAAEFGPNGGYATAQEFSEPHADAPKIGMGTGILLIPTPLHTINGFTKVVRLDGHVAWIQANLLVPYHSLSDPSAICQPALLSNGIYGFTTKP